MPEMPRSTHSNLLADKSCYAYGTDEIYEVPSMRKVELAEESSDKRRISFPQKNRGPYVLGPHGFLSVSLPEIQLNY